MIRVPGGLNLALAVQAGSPTGRVVAMARLNVEAVGKCGPDG